MSAKYNKWKEDPEIIEKGPPEFNQMALYLKRLDDRSNDRDLALNEGNVENFYRATLSLLMNCLPRFEKEGFDDDKILKLQSDILKIGNRVKTQNKLNKETALRNSLVIEEELFKYNVELNILMFKAGLVYPLKEEKKLTEIIKEDF